MNDAKQGAVPTAPQSLTLLCDYIAYYAPHTADCMSRVPFVPQRGFNKRDCDCTLRAAKEHARIVRESTAQLLAERDALRAGLAAMRGALEKEHQWSERLSKQIRDAVYASEELKDPLAFKDLDEDFYNGIAAVYEDDYLAALSRTEPK